MPTYVYECRDCGHRFELFQSFSAEPLRTCPQCREVALRKVLFPAGVVFKGSGFYVNDSRGPRPKKSSTDSKPADSEKPAGEKSATSEKSPASSNGSPKKGREPARSGAK
jgi:putative FmdB family regulatory protein